MSLTRTDAKNPQTNSHTGLTLFALGTIIFFGQGYVLAITDIVASSLFVWPIGNAYETVSPSYFTTYTLALVLIILGVVVFYTAHKENARSIDPVDVMKAGTSNSSSLS